MKRPLRLAVGGAACMIAAGCSSGQVLSALGSDTSSLVSRGCAQFSRDSTERDVLSWRFRRSL